MVIPRIESDFLRHLLEEGYQPGDRLPALNDLSQQVGVSVGKLHEQLEVARALGLVEASPRRALPERIMNCGRPYALVCLPRWHWTRSTSSRLAACAAHLEYAYWDEAVALLTETDRYHLCQLVTEAQVMLIRPRRPIRLS